MTSPLTRDGLTALTGRYIDALVAHDPAAVPLAADARTVENLQRIKPGEGLWDTATAAATSFAIHVPDAERQTAGFIGMMERGGEPILLGLRLKTSGGQITEAEHLIASGIAEPNLANLRTPRPGLLSSIPPGERLPARELLEIGATYYDALENDDGSACPFAADSERHENGLITAGSAMAPPPGSTFPAVARACAAQIDSKVFGYIKAIHNRRVFAADPVTGLAMGLSQFYHPMDNLPYEVALPDGSTTMFAPEFEPFDLPAAHIWKIGTDRAMHEIEAMGFRAPLDAPTGW